MLKTLGSLFESRPGSGEDGLGNRLPGASGAVTGPRRGKPGRGWRSRGGGTAEPRPHLSVLSPPSGDRKGFAKVLTSAMPGF